MYEVVSGCRSCGHRLLVQVGDFGSTPLADELLHPGEQDAHDVRVPLTLWFCPLCTLVQIAETVDPGTLFGERYRYHSSVSDALVAHARDRADELVSSRRLGPRSLVVEIASNDGYMLRQFARRGVRVLGVEPAPGPAEAARAAGIPTLQAFFGADLAAKMRSEGALADVVVANNVLAHVADLNGFVAGIETILAPGGAASIEVPYVRDLVARCEFDTIYHEHLCYFSVRSLLPLLERHGLGVAEVRRVAIHGGSLRLTVRRGPTDPAAVSDLVAAERRGGFGTPAPYLEIARRARRICDRLVAALTALNEAGARVAAYGAAAKGTMLLSAAGIDDSLVAYVVDRSPHKQGMVVPGSGLRVVAPEVLLGDMPDYVLLLAWNFRAEILAQQREYLRRGGRFIVPLPELEVIGRDDA